MYFIEILNKVFKKNNLNKLKLFQNINSEDEQNETKCNHTFVEIDSTGTIFACINCGFVINKSKDEKNGEKK